MVCVKGKSSWTLLSGTGSGWQPVKIRVPDDMADGLQVIRDILVKHKGTTPVIIYSKGKAMKTSRDLWVDPDDAFCAKVRAIVGPDNFKK